LFARGECMRRAVILVLLAIVFFIVGFLLSRRLFPLVAAALAG